MTDQKEDNILRFPGSDARSWEEFSREMRHHFVRLGADSAFADTVLEGVKGAYMNMLSQVRIEIPADADTAVLILRGRFTEIARSLLLEVVIREIELAELRRKGD